MRRRQYLKSLSALPILPSSIVGKDDSDEGKEDNIPWNVRGVWRRKDDTGYLAVRDEDTEAEFQEYNNWVSTTIQRFSGGSHTSHIVDLFDFRLISVYSGEYVRSHFAHRESGLEVTIKRDSSDKIEYSAFVRAVDETWDEAREYASSSQIRLVQKLKRERDEYL